MHTLFRRARFSVQMKRRRVALAAPAPDLTRPSEARTAKQSNSCFDFGDCSAGYLLDSIGIFDVLPNGPRDTSVFVEPTALTFSSEFPAALCNSLSLLNLIEFADPCRFFEFNVMFTRSSLCCQWEDVSRHLRIAAELSEGHPFQAVSLRASTSFHMLPNGTGIRVKIASSWWSHATSFTIVGLYLAGQLIDMPLLPATIKVMHVNHTPSKAGRMWKSSKAGDVASVISAIKDGCSTEESNKKVCTMNLMPNNLSR